MRQVTVIIPAFNEATRIAAVLAAAQAARLVGEIIVVDDGSADDTAAVAASAGVAVIRLAENRGKGWAMRAGAGRARHETVLFLDADLRGLSPDHIDDLVLPVLARQADMTIGIFRDGRTYTDWAQALTPHISGQRCLPRAVVLAAPLLEQCRFGVEVALTAHARAQGLLIEFVPLPGATHVTKEEKRGPLAGLLARGRMYAEMLVTLARYRWVMRGQAALCF